MTEIKIGGFGGQGVILAGMIIGKAAAIFDDKYATHDPGLRAGGARQRLQRPGHRLRRADPLPLRAPAPTSWS